MCGSGVWWCSVLGNRRAWSTRPWKRHWIPISGGHRCAVLALLCFAISESKHNASSQRHAIPDHLHNIDRDTIYNTHTIDNTLFESYWIIHVNCDADPNSDVNIYGNSNRQPDGVDHEQPFHHSIAAWPMRCCRSVCTR